MKRPKKISRRRFLARSGGVVSGLVAAPLVARPGVIGLDGQPGANERVTIGFIGTGHRAKLLMSQTPSLGRIVAVCDVYVKRCAEAIKEKAPLSDGWDVYQNYHRVLERKDIDAVIVPTTDHGRVLPCIHACQAGKDIYAEKPLTLTIAEGAHAGQRGPQVPARVPDRLAAALDGVQPLSL